MEICGMSVKRMIGYALGSPSPLALRYPCYDLLQRGSGADHESSYLIVKDFSCLVADVTRVTSKNVMQR